MNRHGAVHHPRMATRLLTSLAAAAFFLALAWAAAVMMLRVFEPKPRLEPIVPFKGYSLDAMQRAIAPERVQAELDRILAMGSRFMGQPGCSQTAAYIRERFQQAGLEVHEQTYRTAAPRTLRREIYVEEDTAGAPGFQKPDQAEVYPFWPNHMQPMNTPPEGLVGELTLATEDLLHTRGDFSDCIALVDASSGQVPESCGFDWASYAAMGFRAVIIAHPEGLEAMPWPRIMGNRDNPAGGFINGGIPVNFMRLAATPGIFALAGQRIKLCVETRWENVLNTSVFGILHAAKPAHEALVLASDYDACAILPDLAPGVLQAYEPATQLCLLDGLLEYRQSLQRDIVFAAFPGRAMSDDGVNNLLRVLGPSRASAQENRLLAAFGKGMREEPGSMESREQARLETRMAPIQTRMEQNTARLDMLGRLDEAFQDPDFFVEPSRTEAAIEDGDSATRAFLTEQYRYVLSTLVFERSEEALQAKLAFERKPGARLDGPEFQAYLKAKREYDEAQSAAGYGLSGLLRDKQAYAARYEVRSRMRARVEELLAYHQERQQSLEQDAGIVRALNPYNEWVAVLPGFAPSSRPGDAAETASFSGGSYLIQTPERVFEALLASSRQQAGLAGVLNLPKVDRWHDAAVQRELGAMTPYGPTDAFRAYGYQAFRLVNFGRAESYNDFSIPAGKPYMRNAESMRHSLLLAGDAALALAHGVGRFPSLVGNAYDFKGRVLASNVGQSVVPNYPLKNALLGTRSRMNPVQFSAPGYYDIPFAFADPYGQFDFYNSSASNRAFINLPLSKDDGVGYSPMACAFGEDGLISYMKDEGEEGQRLFKSSGLLWNDRERFRDLTIITFRSAPVTMLDLENPQTGSLYGWVELLDRNGLSPLGKRCAFSLKNAFTTFCTPDKRLFVELMAGSPENPLALTTRAFMLGDTNGADVDPRKEIDGSGYLAADTHIVPDVPARIAESMDYVNGKRIALLNQHGMADERANEYQQKAEALFASSREPGKPFHEARIEARDSVTYNELNHPVLRRQISEAVIGILWYLGLLVPFCFFFEKLVFGYADVRKQLAAQAVIFLIVFGLLRVFHPAFEMIRSSLMILLGFIIILVSSGVTLLFSSKAKENLEEIRRRQGKVRAAEINVLGVMATAFLLGLNNMHRRRVRTGLTCGTLVLMTFVAICFTSVQTGIVDEAIAISKAPYPGILVKNKDFEPLDAVSGIVNEYSGRYALCEREMYLGEQYQGQSYNPSLLIAFEPEGAPTRSLRFNSIVKLAAAEPMQRELKFLTHTPWFTPEQERDSGEACPAFIPDTMAQKLGITPARVEQGDCMARINGRDFRIQGIFSAESYNALQDLDGQPLLPFDIEAMANVAAMENNVVLAKDTDPRIPAQQIVLCPAKRDLQLQLQYGKPRRVSMAISMPHAPYKEAKAVIDSYLERKAELVFYGINGVAYRGQRTRETSMAGMIDLLLPLMIAALTVLNTMKGSVYERLDEIMVYNAVGIAPRYVFFMFLAEAAVYSVVGSVLGYLLSQGAGRILAFWEISGGMSTSFTSISTIYASLAITAATFISTYFPARSAMQIATPAEESGWRLPEPEGDVLRFRLPFTFSAEDRIAIMAFFHRYLQDHGEGSAERFFATGPEMGIREECDALADGAYIPMIACTVWLKPFDLAVSQEMSLSAPTDEETGEYIAEISLKRLSGTRESWLRLNVGFVRQVRRHLLHWRAVSSEERAEMFVEGKEAMKQCVTLAP